VVVVTLTAEGIPAALGRAVRTNRAATVGALRYGSLAAQHSDPRGRQVESIAVQTGDKRMGLEAQEVCHRLLHRYG
jgi:hypothetical protein